MTDSEHRLNRQSYDGIAERWDAARATLTPAERPYLDMLVDTVPGGGMILDVGCGTGRPFAAALIERGFHITGIDQSERLLSLARARFPRETWILTPIESWGFDRQYHGAICWDSLFHIAREHHPTILAAIHRSLVPGAPLILTAGGSENPPFTDTMYEHEFFYDSLPPEQLVSLMREIGYRMDRVEYLEVPNGGRNKGRIAIVAGKEASDVQKDLAGPPLHRSN